MKKLSVFVVTMFVLCVFGMNVCYAEPGDIVTDTKSKTLWTIATYHDANESVPVYPTGILQYYLDWMDSIVISYAATNDVDEWRGVIKFDLYKAFSKMFPNEIYATILYGIKDYQYGSPIFTPTFAPPVCTVVSNTITCDEDPSGQDRAVILWRYLGGEYVEQDPVASSYTVVLAAGTWTISPLPSVGNLVVTYDDAINEAGEVVSLPTIFMEIP